VTTGSDDFFLGHGQQDQGPVNLAPDETTIRGTIVPALLKALRTERHNDIVTGAMLALAKIGDVDTESGESLFVKEFERFLGDPIQEIAETAAVALGVLGDERSIATLEDLLRDTPRGRALVGSEAGVATRTRAFAAFGLGQIGHHMSEAETRQRIVDVLWDVCESPKGNTRDVKVAAILSLGLVPLDPADTWPLEEEPPAGPPTTRQAQVDYLIDFFLDERDPDRKDLVRAHAPRSIVLLMEQLDDPALKLRVVKALAPYVKKFGKGVRELRMSASLAYGMLGDLDGDEADALIRERLIDASADTEPQVKRFSLIALGQVGGRPGSGAESMIGIEDVRAHLQRQITRGKTPVKPWAGLAIGVMERGQLDAGQLQSPGTMEALRTALRESRSRIPVGAYAIALGIAQDREAVPELLEKLDSMSDDEARGHIAIGLGLIGAQEAREPIQRVVADSEYRGELLKQAAIALGLLGDKTTVGDLIDMLNGAKTLTTQAAIASALGFIGDQSSVEPLVALLEDTELTDAARGFAAVALGVVADREPLPFTAKFAKDINYRANTVTLTGQGKGLLDIL